MKRVKISIVVPVYNASKYLVKCLDSIISQTYRNIEIILVDDGSTDDSGSICDDYAKKDNRINVFHQKNGGVSFARNQGIIKSNGEFVCFIDSDDLVHPDYIKRLVDNLSSNVLSVCQIENFQNDVIFSKEDKSKIELSKERFIELCKMYLLNTPCCKLFSLDIIRKHKVFFDTELSLGEDLIFNLDYLKYINKIIVANQKLYYYRRETSATLSTSYNSKMVEIQLLLFDCYTEFFENIQMDNNSLCVFDSYRFSILKIIIENEFRNKKVNFWERYLNARKLLNDDKVKSRIKKIHYPKKKVMFFLISHKLILIYKIVNKINSIMQ